MRKGKPHRGPQGAPTDRRPPERAIGEGWIYGRHAVLAALKNPRRRCRQLLATREAAAEIEPHCPDHLHPKIVERGEIDRRLAEDAVHQGLALQADPLPDLDIDEAAAPVSGEMNLVVVLDQVTDPRNVGAILRSAAAFGARAVVVTDRHAPESTGALAKAASGALDRVPLVRVVNLVRALDRLAELGYWRIGLDARADRRLAEVAVNQDKAVLVLGAEGEGLRRLTVEHCDFLARLPITADAESLNVSNAAAIALYEFARLA